jgi:hypothetical protein
MTFKILFARTFSCSYKNYQPITYNSSCTIRIQKSVSKTSAKKETNLDPNNFKNYRPVSNLPLVSKVLEKVVNSHIEDHLTLNDFHEEHQSAYRQFHSTESALRKVHTDILQSLDPNDVTILVMLDLSAAFQF